jgi:hypothetical protein
VRFKKIKTGVRVLSLLAVNFCTIGVKNMINLALFPVNSHPLTL